MKKKCLLLALTMLMVIASGVAHADYIFGGSGGQPNYLDVWPGAGPTTLSTAGPLHASGNDQGWWSTIATNQNWNDNYIVGNLSTNLYNDFFTFDISGLSGQTVTHAYLRLYTYSVISSGNQTYSLYDVSTNPVTLNTVGNGPSVAIYTDLGTGVNYGSLIVNPSDSDRWIAITLNTAGITDLNRAISNFETYFSIGGTTSPGAPIPGSLVLLGSGMLSLAGLRLRRR